MQNRSWVIRIWVPEILRKGDSSYFTQYFNICIFMFLQENIAPLY